MNKQVIFLFFLISIFLFTACDREPTNVEPTVKVEDVAKIAEMNRQFGLDVFKELVRQNANQNILISPWSIQSALQMAINGADGKTLEEMLKVLYCENCDTEDINLQQALLRIFMEKQSGHPTLTSANGYFYDNTRIAIEDVFKQKLVEHYLAEFQHYNFGDPATVDAVNDWVKEATRDKIDGIIEEISNDDLAFLINALHFKADWATGFDKDLTHTATFTKSDRTTKEVEYVSADRDFHHVSLDNAKMVDIPFRDSTYSLSLIQFIDESVSINSLDESFVLNLYDKMQYGRAWVTFPKMDLEFDESLISALDALGMEQAFIPQLANFSLMGQPLIGPTIYISQIRHKATLEVDEQGAEGAAVTSITFSTTSLPPTYNFNSPYILILRHIPTQTFLFLGLVDDPVKS